MATEAVAYDIKGEEHAVLHQDETSERDLPIPSVFIKTEIPSADDSGIHSPEEASVNTHLLEACFVKNEGTVKSDPVTEKFGEGQIVASNDGHSDLQSEERSAMGLHEPALCTDDSGCSRSCHHKNNTDSMAYSQENGTSGISPIKADCIGATSPESADNPDMKTGSDMGVHRKGSCITVDPHPDHSSVRRSSQKLFSCDCCSYTSVYKSNVKRHQRTHTKEKPYACGHCSYRASLKATLEQHIFTHTKDKPHACPVCSYRSTQRTNLKKHMHIHMKLQ